MKTLLTAAIVYLMVLCSPSMADSKATASNTCSKESCNVADMLTAKVNFLVASNRLTEAKKHPDALKHLKQSMDDLEKEYEAAKTKYESLQKDVEVRGHIHEKKENNSEPPASPRTRSPKWPKEP